MYAVLLDCGHLVCLYVRDNVAKPQDACAHNLGDFKDEGFHVTITFHPQNSLVRKAASPND
jgi:hypothetical protein